MKRAVFLVVVGAALLFGAVSASAQFRVDIDVNYPVYFGYSVTGSAAGAWNQYFIPVPDFRASWQFGNEFIDGGIGVRWFTFIIENFIYPEGYVELNLDPFVLSLSVGGFAFLEFGILSAALQDAGINNLTGFHTVILPDVDFSWKVARWFQLGVGVFMIAPFGANIGGVLDNFVYSGYIRFRFIIKTK
jgi:hypothetical protein